MVVVIGGGITGAATSHYLTKLSRGRVPVTLIDAVDNPATTGCSRGAGAFLAAGESWGVPRARALHRKSFELHAALAGELGLESYRKLPAVFGVRYGDDVPPKDDKEQREEDCIPWLAEGISHISPLPGKAASVDPSELVEALLKHSRDNGAECLLGSAVTGCTTTEEEEGDRVVSSVKLAAGESIPVSGGEDVVFAMGAWSSRLEDWLGMPVPIEGVWSTSAIWERQRVMDDRVAAALFCEEDTNGCRLEILPRCEGSLYVSGCGQSRVVSPAVFRSSDSPKPGETNRPDASRIKAATRSLEQLGPILIDSDRPDIERACVRPVSPDGVPIVGRLPGFNNVLVATGGGPWGITFGPVVGLAIASLILDDYPPINLRGFSPRRFDTPVYRTLLKQRGKQAGGKAIGEQW